MDTGRRVGERAGYTLVELMLTVSLLGVLAAVAGPQFLQIKERAKAVQAIVHLKTISDALEIYGGEYGTLPLVLSDVDPELTNLTDPWGAPYNYTRVEGAPIGQLRKDKFLVPINSDYDLWSNGPDGSTVMALTAKPSRDDIIRASDGSYFGRAAGY